MRIDLKGKRALVGGSTGGIGKAIAIELSKCGASVTLMARDVEKLNKTIAELAIIENSSHSFVEVDFDNFNNLELLIKDFFDKYARSSCWRATRKKNFGLSKFI